MWSWTKITKRRKFAACRAGERPVSSAGGTVASQTLISGRLSSAAGENKDQSDEEKPAEADEAQKKPSPTLEGLLRARAALERLLEPQLQGSFLVSLNGVESGEIEAVVRARGKEDEVGCLRIRGLQIPIVS